MAAAALWPSGLLVFLTYSLTDCLDLIGKDSLAPLKTVWKDESLARLLPADVGG